MSHKTATDYSRSSLITYFSETCTGESLETKTLALNLIEAISDEAKYVFASNVMGYHDMQDKLMKEGTIVNVSGNNIKREYTFTESRLLKQEIASYLNVSQRILEIGSGALDKAGKSYLMDLFPNAISKKMVPIDFDQGFKAQLQLVDLRELDQSFKQESFDSIIGNSTIDTIRLKDLDRVIDNIAFCLKKGGYFLHTMSRIPYENTILDAYSQEDLIFLPHFKEKHLFKGVKVIQKNQLLNAIDQSLLSEFEMKFFKLYATLSSIHRGYFLENLFELNKEALFKISKIFEKIKGLEEVNNHAFFEKNIETALSKKFKIEKKAYITVSELVAVEKGQGGLEISMIHGEYSERASCVLQSNWNKVTLETLVIVAKKE